MITIKEIAQQAGFSPSTVSRLLSNDPSLSVSPETKQKILNTALSLGYERKYIKTIIEKIALLFWITEIEELEDIYFKDMRLKIEKYANENNMELVTIKKESGISKIPKDINGFIAIGSFSEKEISKLLKITKNGVFIDSNPAPDYYDSVQPNTPLITKKAIDYFIKNGHSNIGFIGGTFHNPNTDLEEKDIREVAFRSYMQKIGYSRLFLLTYDASDSSVPRKKCIVSPAAAGAGVGSGDIFLHGSILFIWQIYSFFFGIVCGMIIFVAELLQSSI